LFNFSYSISLESGFVTETHPGLKAVLYYYETWLLPEKVSLTWGFKKYIISVFKQIHAWPTRPLSITAVSLKTPL